MTNDLRDRLRQLGVTKGAVKVASSSCPLTPPSAD